MNTPQWMIAVAVPMALLGAALSIGSLVLRSSPDLSLWVGTGLTGLSAFTTTYLGILRFKAVGQEPTGPILLVAIVGAMLMTILLAASVAALSFMFLVRHHA
jgi:hypothetical protein